MTEKSSKDGTAQYSFLVLCPTDVIEAQQHLVAARTVCAIGVIQRDTVEHNSV